MALHFTMTNDLKLVDKDMACALFCVYLFCRLELFSKNGEDAT